MTSIIRGIRNNNPLNIRISPARWQGKVDPSKRTDKTFEQFTVPGQAYKAGDKQQRIYGYRAAIRLLRTYLRTYRLNTIELIVNRWAPEADKNKPIIYAQTVSKLTGIPQTRTLEFEEDVICHLVAAMAKVESAVPYGQDDALIRKAWELKDR